MFFRNYKCKKDVTRSVTKYKGDIKPVLEKDITNKILKYLKTQDKCYCFKEHGGSYGSAGIPDIICCYHGRFVAFEVKTEKGRTTKLQDINIRNIHKADGVALVVRSLDEVKDALKELIKSDG